MIPNPLLSITIPTYNRADFLDYSLEVHIPLVREYNIQIYISDNASTDFTKKIVEKWQKKYPLIHYFHNETNVGPDKNFELALKYPKTDYVWLLGDTYHLQPDVFKYVLNLISTHKYDHIIINIANEVNDIPTQDYIDQNKLLTDLFWLMTCLSIHIYNRTLINNANFSRYRNTNFMQTGIIFEYLDNKDFTLHWNQLLSVERIFSYKGRGKETWFKQYFEIWLENRINFIMSLPPSYKLSIKLKCIMFDGRDKTSLGILKLIYLKTEHILTYKKIIKYKYLLPLVTKKSNFTIFLIAIFPHIGYKLLRFLWRLLKRSN